jgi:hypothetical protein
VAISSDCALTSANIPWIFRLDPGATPVDAVRCLTEAAMHAGVNHDAIRAYLASGAKLANRYSFRSNGELR